MPSATCEGCGLITNSSTSNFWLNTEDDGKTKKQIGVATKCYAAFVDGKWVKGCGYDGSDIRYKRRLEKLLENREHVNDFEM